MKRPTRILVVDDEPEILRLYAEVLRSNGYDVWEAATGELGLQTAREIEPDLVLLDVMLPGMNGLEVCGHIKTDPALADSFVVLVSGAAVSAADKVDGLGRAADDYLVKPMEMGEFLARIRTLIRLRDTTAALRQSEEHYRRLVEILPDAVGLIDLEGRILEANLVAAVSMGYKSPADVVGKSLFDMIRPEEQERLRANIALTLETGATRGAEYTMQRVDGGGFPVELSAALLTLSGSQARELVVVARDITERKRAEETLRRREELGRRTIESAMDGFCRLDLEGRFLEPNQAFCRIVGYSRKELLSLRVIDLEVGKRNQGAVVRHLERITRLGGDRFETRYRRKDGHLIDVEVSVTCFELEGRHLFAFVRDISERKRAERQKAAFSSLGYRLSAAETPNQAAKIILDIASDLVGWDAGYIHLYSPTENQVVPLLTMDTVQGRQITIEPENTSREPTPMLRLVLAEGAQLIENGQRPPPGVTLVPFGDTARRSASAMYVPLHLGGAAVGVLSVQSYTSNLYSRDDLKLLQTLADHCGEALHRIQTRAALEAAEAKYRSIFENTSEGIFQTTLGGVYLSANPAMARMLGYETPQELISKVTDIGRQIHVVPGKREEFRRLVLTAGAVRDFEAELYRKDGAKIWVSFSAHVVRDPAGEVLFLEGSCQDITARKKAEAELRQFPHRIFEAQEAERMRVARELHDGVNQIIASAKMRLHNLGEKRARLGPAGKEILLRCQRLLAQALDENRRIARDLRPSDLDQLGLADACRNLARQIESQTGLEVKCHIWRRLERLAPEVELHLFRIVQEALSNVAKHADAKTVQLRLTVQADQVVVRVRDDGRGIALNSSPAGKGNGGGTGLNNMRERAAFLGGSCEVVSAPNAGTAVTVRVPHKLAERL